MQYLKAVKSFFSIVLQRFSVNNVESNIYQTMHLSILNWPNMQAAAGSLAFDYTRPPTCVLLIGQF